MEVVNLPKGDKLKASIEETKRNMPLFVEHMELVARLRRAHYDACIKWGFTKEQALELTKYIGV